MTTPGMASVDNHSSQIILVVLRIFNLQVLSVKMLFEVNLLRKLKDIIDFDFLIRLIVKYDSTLFKDQRVWQSLDEFLPPDIVCYFAFITPIAL